MMKKLITALLAGVMAVGMAVPSFAATYEDIVVNGACNSGSCWGKAGNPSGSLDTISVDIEVYSNSGRLSSPYASKRNVSSVRKDYTYPSSIVSKVKYITVSGEGQKGRDRYTCSEAKTYYK